MYIQTYDQLGWVLPQSLTGTPSAPLYTDGYTGCQNVRQAMLARTDTARSIAQQRPACRALNGSTTQWNLCESESTCTGNVYVRFAAGSSCTSCPSGYTGNGSRCVPQECPAGEVLHTGTLYQTGASATGYCVGSCAVTPSGSVGGVCVEAGSGPAACSYGGPNGLTWTATGSACPDQRTQPQSSPVVTTASGQTYTLQPQGCGTVNGESFCAGELPTTTGCVQTAGGQMFCTSTTPAPPAPRQPGTNTPPPADSQLQQVTNNNTTTTINHYNNTTVTNNPPGGTTTGGTTTGTTTGGTTTGDSTGGGGGGGGTTGGSTGGTTTGTTTGGTGGTTTGDTTGGMACGGSTGQPACKIDETGTPTDKDLTTSTGYDHEAAGDALNDVANTSPLSGLGIMDSLTSLSFGANTCISISPSFTARNRTYTFTFPGERGCNMIETIKGVLAWLIGILTVVYIVRRFASV